MGAAGGALLTTAPRYWPVLSEATDCQLRLVGADDSDPWGYSRARESVCVIAVRGS